MTSRATGTFELTGLTGEATIYRWRAAGTINRQIEPEEAVVISLRNATIRGVLVDAEAFQLHLIAGPDGRAAVGGDEAALRVRPAWLEADWDTTPSPVRQPLAVPRLDPRALAGWSATGNAVPELGPLHSEPAISATGGMQLELQGGNVTIAHGDGSIERVRLSAEPDASGGASPVERHTKLIFEGTVGSARVPVHGYWLVAGPAPEWGVDGSARWARASGTANGISFRDEPVHVVGAFGLTPDPSRNGALEAARFGLEGDYTLTAGGVVLTPEPARAPAAVAAWTIGGVLAALLAFFASPHLAGRIVAPFYTRIAATDIAMHPARSRICELLAASPGLHLRDLHRRLGGAWGTFSFHLGMLRQAGAVRFERDGRYVATYLAHQASAAHGPRGETAQRILDALPRDGSRIPVTKLREGVGLSRQLLDHHLAALAEQGLVEIATERRPRLISRK